MNNRLDCAVWQDSPLEQLMGGARWTDMENKPELYDEATKVTAVDGEVILDGPDGVDVRLTPEAAEETSNSLLEGAVKAAGQRRLKDLPHRAR